jgi:acetyl-CoA carboxylase carboxyltransferase component
MLDAIIDLRTPRILLILRNAFGGAYAAFNSYATGASTVLALPTTRLAVMGTAGKEFVFKKELRQARDEAASRREQVLAQRLADGATRDAARATADKEAADWLKAREGEFNARYERELMNPREALSLGSISEIVMPADLRSVLGHNLDFLLRHYVPGPMESVQREFH